MTQVANTVNTWDWQPSNVVQGTICPSCGQWYAWGTFHQCSNTSLPIYQYDWFPKQDPFVEFKKLYRKLVAEEMAEQIIESLEDDYKDSIDKPVREDLSDWIRGVAQGIINEEPRP